MSEDMLKYIEDEHVMPDRSTVVEIGRQYGVPAARVFVGRATRSRLATIVTRIADCAWLELSVTAPELRLIAQALLSAAVDIEREAGQ